MQQRCEMVRNLFYIYFLFAEELTHSDGDPFDPKNDYNIGLRKYKDDYDCFYLKQTDDYKLQGTVCTKEKNFFCLWQEHECPEEYRYILSTIVWSVNKELSENPAGNPARNPPQPVSG